MSDEEDKPPLKVVDQEYLASEEADDQSNVVEVHDWEKNMEVLAAGKGRLSVPRNKEFSRKQVVNAFQNAFELIGGTPRLALWAHENESDFYKLYARLLPSQSSSALGESNELVVKHILPKGPLDGE